MTVRENKLTKSFRLLAERSKVVCGLSLKEEERFQFEVESGTMSNGDEINYSIKERDPINEMNRSKRLMNLI